MSKSLPQRDMLEWERQLWDGGYEVIAGVDEVGRGALAGPLVAAAVILPGRAQLIEDATWSAITDSKVISAKKRSLLATFIHDSGASISIGEVPSAELDEIGVAAANRTAMERAVRGLSQSPDMLLIDALTIDLDVDQIGIIDGDASSLSIAAASIVAKVHRDALMTSYHNDFTHYGFARHKGYGVAAHLAALVAHGPCPIHRRSFAPVARAWQQHGKD